MDEEEMLRLAADGRRILATSPRDRDQLAGPALSVETGLHVFRNAIWGEAHEFEHTGRVMDEMLSCVLLGLGYVIASLQEGRYNSSDELKWAVQDCITRNWRLYTRRED